MESLAGALAKVHWLALTKTLAAEISLLMQDGHKRVVTLFAELEDFNAAIN